MHIFTLYELPLLKVNNKDKLTELLMIKNKKIILKLSKVENLILILMYSIENYKSVWYDGFEFCRKILTLLLVVF